MTNQRINKVAVVMSTYNGEKYIIEQIESILAQKDVEIYLYVRDDGSSDGTQKILTEYSQKYDNITVDFGCNVGVGNSFMNALYAVPDLFDYYALADQDDIWCEDKLIQAIGMLQSSGKVLYASNQENVDESGNSLGLRYDENTDIRLDPFHIILRNKIAGCTMVFTRGLFEKLVAKNSRPSNELLYNRIHDVWIAAAASVCGGIVYDERSFIKYRQHGNNVVGAYDGGLKKGIKSKITKVFHKEQRNGRSMLARELVRCFDSAKDFPLVVMCANAKKRQLWKHGKKIRSYTGESSIGYFCKILLGLF